MKSELKSGKLYTIGLKKTTRRTLITGLLVVLPIFVTFFVIKFLFNVIGGILSPVVTKTFIYFGFSPSSTIDEFIVTSIAFVLTFVALYSIGAIATNFFGKLILRVFETIVHNTPIIKNVYTSSKKLIEIISLPK